MRKPVWCALAVLSLTGIAAATMLPGPEPPEWRDYLVPGWVAERGPWGAGTATGEGDGKPGALLEPRFDLSQAPVAGLEAAPPPAEFADHFDGMSETDVPEPGAMLLLGLGFVALGLLRRRRGSGK